MANKKITQLNLASSVLDTDLLAVVVNPGGSPETKKSTIATLLGTAPRTGWIADAATWVYASATTILITGNVVAKFPIGTKLQLTQTTVKYFRVITAEILTGNTILTITGGGWYTLADAVISATYYSYVSSPQGWPGWSNWIHLLSPLTSTAWDGDLRSTTAKTLIDLSAVFGVPAGVKAVNAVVWVWDAGSAAGNCFIILGPNNVASQGFITPCSGIANGKVAGNSPTIPCNINGDIYFEVSASGAGTLGCILQIWGYEI